MSHEKPTNTFVDTLQGDTGFVSSTELEKLWRRFHPVISIQDYLDLGKYIFKGGRKLRGKKFFFKGVQKLEQQKLKVSKN